MASGTAMAWSLGLRSSVYVVPHVGGMYAAVPALVLNLAVATVLTALLRPTGWAPAVDRTDPSAYIG